MQASRDLAIRQSCLRPVILFLALAGPAPARAELVSHFSLDGTLEDQGPGANDGTFFGDLDPTFVDGQDGTPGGALGLDGVDDYVELTPTTDLPLSHLPAFTVAMWVKGLPQQDKRVFSESTSSSGTPLFNIGTHNTSLDGTVDSFIRATAGTIANHRHSTGIGFDDLWHHIAWVDDNGQVTLYIDAIPDTTVFDYVRPAQEMNITTLGGISRPNHTLPLCCFFAGALDDVRLYNHALTEAEVMALVPGGGCPQTGDTTCDAILVEGPPSGGPGVYTITSFDAQDASGDAIIYTFTADDGAGTVLAVGPQAQDSAQLTLTTGMWTIKVTVDDQLNCDDTLPAATCMQAVTVTCPGAADTSCDALAFDGPAGGAPGTYTLTANATDLGGDPILYTYTADNGVDPPIVRGPAAGVDTASFTLGPGQWTITVTVDDDPLCDDDAGNVCTTQIGVSAQAPALVSHLKLDGDLTDSQPAGNDGFFNGDVTPTFTAGADGASPGAVLLDGIDDFLDLNYINGLPIYANNAYTVAIWVKGPPAQLDRRVFSEANLLGQAGVAPPHPLNINPLLNIGTHNQGTDGTVDVYIRGDTGQNPVAHRHSVRAGFDDTWHHIAWVDDDGKARLYIDAVRDETDFQYARVPLTLDSTNVGGIRRAEPSHWFMGEIDDVRLYNHALSLAEVEAIVPERAGCPGDRDTSCGDLVVGAPEGNFPGTYSLTANGAADISGDAILYTFVAENAAGGYIQRGPDFLNTVQVRLGAGAWTISVKVDDDLHCRDDAANAVCSRQVTVIEPPRNLLSHWKFDGSLDDSGVAGNDGAIFTGAPPVFGDDHAGMPGSAICFDGLSDSFVQVAIARDLPIYTSEKFSAYSIALWVKGPPQNDRRVYSESSSTLGEPLFNIGTQNLGQTGQVDIYIRTDANAVVMNHVLSQAVAFDDTWHHIAWVDRNGDADLYVDGVLDGVDFAHTKPTNLSLDTATIGGILRAVPCCRFQGCIDDVRVYNYALTEEEIQMIISSQPPEEVCDNSQDDDGDLLTDCADPDCAAQPSCQAPRFVRGDVNADGRINITDPIYGLAFSFQGGPAPPCRDAADADDASGINITDPIYLLAYLFQGGPRPPGPSPGQANYVVGDCGVDVATDNLDCLGFSPCGL